MDINSIITDVIFNQFNVNSYNNNQRRQDQLAYIKTTLGEKKFNKLFLAKSLINHNDDYLQKSIMIQRILDIILN